MSTTTYYEFVKKNLGYMLLESNLIDKIQMQIALEEQKRTGKKFGSTLIDLKFIDENVLAAFLSKQMDIPCINLMHVEVSRDLIAIIPEEVARKCQAVPIKIHGQTLYMAMVDPTDINLISELEELTDLTVSPFIAPQSTVNKKVNQLYCEPDKAESKKTNPIFADVIKEEEERDQVGKKLSKIEAHLVEIHKILKDLLTAVQGDER